MRLSAADNSAFVVLHALCKKKEADAGIIGVKGKGADAGIIKG